MAASSKIKFKHEQGNAVAEVAHKSGKVVAAHLTNKNKTKLNLTTHERRSIEDQYAAKLAKKK